MTLLLSILGFVAAEEAVDASQTSEGEAPPAAESESQPEAEESAPKVSLQSDLDLYNQTLDNIELEVIQQKVSLLEERLRYLNHKKSKIDELKDVDQDCLQIENLSEDKDLERKYYLTRNATERRH